jgi:hypothetical protein
MAALISIPAAAQTQIKPGFNLFSTEQDVEIGRQSAIEVERQLPILSDRTVQAAVDAVGGRLAAVIPGTKFRYQFKVVDASDINAFALPGGYMYLNRGLIEAAKTEGQLAGVMAHEMAHVALRHGTNQASKAYLGQAGLGLLGGLLGQQDNGSTSKVVGAVGGFGLNALFLKFSRTDEEQADVVDAQTLAKAGYDPQDMVAFFDVLRAQQSRDPSKVEQFFSSHPAPKDRAARVRNEMKMLKISPTPPTGGFRQAKTVLASMPPARTTQQIAQNRPASPQPRTYPTEGTVGTVEAPSTTFQAFVPRKGLFRIEHPSNWRAYPSSDGVGVTLAPEGGFVSAGGLENDLVYGVVVNHYAPFLDDANEADGRFSFQPAPGAGISVSRTTLAAATNDLVSQIVRTNTSLKPLADSQRTDTIDGQPALSLVLVGRSAVTRGEERVTVFTRQLPDEHVVYALFIAPGQDYPALGATFNHMISSLRVNDESPHN